MDAKEFKQILSQLSKDDKIRMDVKSLSFGQHSLAKYKYQRIKPPELNFNSVDKYSAESNYDEDADLNLYYGEEDEK